MTTWADQSGNGGANLVPMGILSATYAASDADYNGKPSIANALKTSANLAYSTFSIFIVGKVTQTPTNDWLYGHQSNYSTSDYDASDATASTNAWRVKNSAGVFLGTGTKALNWAYTLGRATFTFIYDGTTAGSQMRLNGVAETISGTNHTPSTTTALWCWLGLNTGNQSNTGTVAEIIIYNRAVTSTERDQIESYLRTRYAHY